MKKTKAHYNVGINNPMYGKVGAMKGRKHPKGMLGKKHSQETKKKLRLARKGRKPNLGKKTSEKTKLLLRATAKGKTYEEIYGTKKAKELKEIRSKAKAGKKSHFWKGGLTKERKQLYDSYIYKEWRLSIFKRDNFTCVNCKQVGGYLESHHIKPYRLFPELIFDLDNGVTLCKECHMLLDNKRGQFRKRRKT